MGIQIGPVTPEDEQAILDDVIDENYNPAPETEVEETMPVNEEGATGEVKEEVTVDQIIYTGSVNGATVILIVDFKTTEVTGSVSLTGDDYINANINDGKINLDTLEINTKYSGTGRLEAEGDDYPVNGTITGKISDDLSTFQGTIKSDYENEGTGFIATKDDQN
jgi:hypothetical protein